MRARDSILDMTRFTALLGDLGWPEAIVGTERIAGEAAWRDVLPVTGRDDRQTALRGLGDVLLTATDEGRERWRQFHHDRGRPGLPPTMPPADLAAHLHEYLLFFGDPALLTIVVRGLLSAPLCVIEHAIDETVWLGVGSQSRAWTSSARLIDREGRDRQRMVVLGPDTDETCVRHEMAHNWHAPLPGRDGTVSPACCTVGEAGLREHARESGWIGMIDEYFSLHERLAEACGVAWRERDA